MAQSIFNKVQVHQSKDNVTPLVNELGNDICNVLPAFQALIGSDFTRTFYQRSKIWSFKKLMKTPSQADLLCSLQTENAIVSKVIDFVIIMDQTMKEH